MKQLAINLIVILGLTYTAFPAEALAQRQTRINIGTVAPKGTPWHEILQEIDQAWRDISDGRIRLTIFTDGMQGDENEMLRKLRRGQLQAVGLSGAGLALAEPGVSALNIPMLISSYEELDYIRDRMAPTLEALLEEQNLIVLNWSDVGWVHFFTKERARTLDDIRQMKLFIYANDPDSEELYREFGFQPIPSEVTSLIPGLETGRVDAFDMPPLFALSGQSFGLAPYMIPVKWAPLVAATVIDKGTWEGLPPNLRPQLLEAARAAGERLRDDIRQLGEEAIATMQDYGLEVIEWTAELEQPWREEAEDAYSRLRGRLAPADLFDEAIRLRDEFRTRQNDR